MLKMLHNEARELLVETYEKCKDAKRVEEDFSVGESTVECTIEAIGYTLKKKSLYASERDRVRCTGKTPGMERNRNA